MQCNGRIVVASWQTIVFVACQGVADGSLEDVDDLYQCHARCVSDRQLPVAADAVMNAILRLADVPHSVISTGSSPTATEQQQQRLQAAQVRVDHRRQPRGPASSPRRRVSGSNHYRRPLSTDAHAHLRTTAVVRSANTSPLTGPARSANTSPLAGPTSRLGFRAERAARTLDRLERTASDFDVRMLDEKSTTLPKSDGRGTRHRRGLSGGKGGNASDGDDIDGPPGRLSRKRRTRIWFKNLFRSTDKSSDTTKLFGRKTGSRKMWENCV